MKAALITGATGGIGLEFAKLFAKQHTPLILVARNAEKLEKLAAGFREKYGVQVLTITQNLSVCGAAECVYDKVHAAGWTVEYLINNAGFGDWNRFVDCDWKKQNEMIHLNILTLTAMCRFFGHDMRRRKSGRILNVASVAAFLPGPYLSVYFASKAYVLSFSRAIAQELKADGVTVTVLCPAPTKTNFENAANLKASPMFHVMKPASARDCARSGYRAMMRGQTVICHTLATKMVRLGVKLVPASFAAKQAIRVNGIPAES